MSVEEIERYNVLADEIRKLGSELQTAEKSWEIAANRYHEAFQTEVRIEKALARLDERLGAIEERIDVAYDAEFTQLKCLLDLTNKRLKSLELRCSSSQRRQRRSKR